MKKYFLALLALSCYATPPLSSDEEQRMSNVRFAVEYVGLTNELELVGPKGKGAVIALPKDSDKDLTTLLKIVGNKKTWSKDGPISGIMHIRSDGSFRSRTKPSFHLAIDREGNKYECFVHIDNYRSGLFKHPIDTLKHITFEFVPHNILHMRPSQRKITEFLTKNFGAAPKPYTQ